MDTRAFKTLQHVFAYLLKQRPINTFALKVIVRAQSQVAHGGQ